MKEPTLKGEEKANPVYKQVKSWVIALAVSLTHPSAYDIIGVFPDIDSFWKYKFEEIKNFFEESISIEGVIEKTSVISNRQSQNLITGSDFLALPAAKEDPEIENEEEED